MLAAVTVSNSADLMNGDTSSITALMANDGGDGISLREAIRAAVFTSGDDSITFDGSVFTSRDDRLIRLTQGQLPIVTSTGDLSIDATSVSGIVITGDANDDDVTISGTRITDVSASFALPLGGADDLLDDNSRVLAVAGSGVLTLAGLTITGGRTTVSGNPGGGIFFESSGTLNLIASNVSGNSTIRSGNSGGGIYARNPTSTISGGLSLTDSTVSGNSIITYTSSSSSYGGGIYANNLDVTLIRSTVSDNSVDSEGGGIFASGSASDPASLSLQNSTVSNNRSGGNGGGIGTAFGAISLSNSTVVENFAGLSGGGINEIHDFGSSLTISNSIVAGNTATTSNDLVGNAVNPPVVNYSLIGDTAGSFITPSAGTGNILNQPALLGPLSDNGGLTETHALLTGSPAIDAGSDTLAAGLATDQRGLLVRSFDDPTASGAGVDMGAFELQTLSPVLVVDNRVDENDGDVSAGKLSLREAIGLTNFNLGANTITFDGSVFTGGDNSVIRLTKGELVISESVSIDGTPVSGVVITGDATGDDITVSGTQITDVSASFGGILGLPSDRLDDNSRVLNFSGSTGDLTLAGMTITGGLTAGSRDDGGGIRFNSSGTLTLNQSSVSGNSTRGGSSDGGGIYTVIGSMFLSNSTVSGNSTRGSLSDGGGIRIGSGNVTLTNSTVSGNSSRLANGGGIDNGSGDVTLINSTVSGNSSGVNGGGIRTGSGSISLTNSTMKGNLASEAGGAVHMRNGIFSPPATLTISNAIVAGNFENNTPFLTSTPNDLAPDAGVALEINHSLIGVTGELQSHFASMSIPIFGSHWT